MMNLALCSFLLVGLVRGFNPAAVVPSQAVTRVQPQTGPTRTNPYVLPDSFSPSGRSFLPPTRPSDPALTATMSEAGAWETTVQGVEETAPRQADGDSWMTLEAGMLGSVLGALSVLGARLWRQSSAAPQHRSLFSMPASDPSGSMEVSRMPGGAEAVYAASPGLSGALHGPLVAHFADEEDKCRQTPNLDVSRRTAGLLLSGAAWQLFTLKVAPADAASYTLEYEEFKELVDKSKKLKIGDEIVENPTEDMLLKAWKEEEVRRALVLEKEGKEPMTRPVKNADGSVSYLPPVVTKKSSPEALALGKHLKEIGATMYGAFWCSHCYGQKQVLGSEVADEYMDYVECDKKGANTKRDFCKKTKKVDGFPTWEIKGKFHPGEKSLEELAKLSGFDLKSI